MLSARHLLRNEAALFLLLPGLLFATSYTASVSGNWNSATTWGGAGVPGNGDTCAISDGVIVTVTDAEICGNSPAAGTIVLNFNGSGVLVVASGGTFRLRGDGQWTAGDANTTAYLTVQAGGAFIFDAHLASSPSTTTYKITPDASGWGARQLVTLGSTVSRATVTSDPGGGNGYFTTVTVGGWYSLQWTDFSRIGDGTNDAFRVFWADAAHNQWVSMYNTFDNCGRLPKVDNAISVDGVFKHNFNVHTNSLGTSVMRIGGASNAATTGVRELVGNVFDIAADAGMDGRSFTIHSNYFANLIGMSGFGDVAVRWTLFSNNFLRDFTPAGQYINALGDSSNNLWFLDAHTFTNIHGPGVSLASMNYSGEIGDWAGKLTSAMGTFFIGNASSSGTPTYNFTNSLILPGSDGLSASWLGGPTTIATTTEIFSHNTAVVTDTVGSSDPALAIGHDSINPDTSTIHALSNIFWGPTGAPQYYKLAAIHDVVSNVDVCPPIYCDYNVGWNTLTTGGGFPGGANGYAARFSSTPGVHDIGADPMFLDMTRNVATFDTAYLGRTATAWSSGATYSVGDIVSSAANTVYASTAMGFPGTGAVINYRYVNGTYGWDGTTCSGANPQPGLYNSTSRACWEWASLYDLRIGVGYCTISCPPCPGAGVRNGGQCLYEDSDIGVYGNDIITTLIQWIKTGYSPGNTLLVQAGSDGYDMGAVPVRLPATTFPGFVVGGSTVKGKAVQRGKAVIR